MLCRKCWEQIRATAEAGAAAGGHFRNGALVTVCGICEEVISFEGGILQGVVIDGEHDNPNTGRCGRSHAPICLECWTRILLNVALDMAAMLSSEEEEINVSYS